MEVKRNLILMKELALPRPSSVDLRGRQSVRATFKLSPKAIEALSMVAVLLGIKQKSVFDHLIEDDRSLGIIAREVNSDQFSALERIQKTFVISRRSLLSLDKTAKRFNASRDALVELSIQRLLPIIYREREKHKKRKIFLHQINHFVDRGLTLFDEFEAVLGKDDPVMTEFKDGIDALVNAQSYIEAFIGKGQMIEQFSVQDSAFGHQQPNTAMKNF